MTLQVLKACREMNDAADDKCIVYGQVQYNPLGGRATRATVSGDTWMATWNLPGQEVDGSANAALLLLLPAHCICRWLHACCVLACHIQGHLKPHLQLHARVPQHALFA